MADPSSSQAGRSDSDLEKGAPEVSDFEAATIVADAGDSEPAAQGGPSGEKDHSGEVDPNVVSWDGPDDPENPMNWTDRKKWSNIAVLSILTIIT